MPKYVFVVLKPYDTNVCEIKTIMNDKTLIAKSGEMCFYASYKELYNAYSGKFPDQEMWGIGFLVESLEKEQKWIEAERRGGDNDSELRRWRVEANQMNLSSLEEKQDFFLIVPDDKALKELCFYESEGKGETWRYRGIRNNVCKNYNEKEIDAYLKKKYRCRDFDKENGPAIPESPALFCGDDGLCHGYTLLDMSPKEMHEGVKMEKVIKQEGLF